MSTFAVVVYAIMIVGGLLFSLGADLIEEERGTSPLILRFYALTGLVIVWFGVLFLSGQVANALHLEDSATLWRLKGVVSTLLVFGLFSSLKYLWFRPWMRKVDATRELRG